MNLLRSIALVVVALAAPSSPAADAGQPAAAPGEEAPRPPPEAAVPETYGTRGWGVHGGARMDYRVEEDASVPHEGRPSLRLFPIEGPVPGYATFMRSIDVGEYAGKRVRIATWIRTAGVTGRGDVWSRTMGLSGPRNPALDSAIHVSLPADGDWKLHEMLLDVQAEALKLQYGVGIDGPGVLWLAEPTVEIVGDAGGDAVPAGR